MSTQRYAYFGDPGVSREMLPRASHALQAGGHRFDPGWLHWRKDLQLGRFLADSHVPSLALLPGDL
jgi:hypothetical protein